MAYRLTNFSNASNEQEVATGARAINQFNAAVKRAESDLQAGRFPEAFKQAEVAQARLDSAKKMIVSKKITTLYPAASDADLVMRGLWSQFQAQKTGRSNFGFTADEHDGLAQNSGGTDSLLDKASSKAEELLAKGEAAVNAAGDIVDKGGKIWGKVSGAYDKVASLSSGDTTANIAPGTLVKIPSCVGGNFPPMVAQMFQNLGVGTCAADEDSMTVLVPYGAPTDEIRRRIEAGRQAGRNSAMVRAANGWNGSGGSAARGSDRAQNAAGASRTQATGNDPGRIGPGNAIVDTSGGSGGGSGLGTSIAVGLGLFALKRLFFK